MRKETWIIFLIKNQRVAQMSNGAGYIRIVAFRECLAYQHGVKVNEVYLKTEEMTQTNIVSSEVRNVLIQELS